jgi:hypothetical protein
LIAQNNSWGITVLKKTLALLLLAAPVLVAGCGSDADPAAVPG